MRHAGAAVYHAARDRIIMYGGTTDGAPLAYDDTWEYVEGDASAAPLGRWWTTAWSSTPPPRGRMVVFGGESSLGTPTDDVYGLAGAVWVGPIVPPVRPSPRAYSAAASDEALGETVIYGGEPDLDDMWSWDGGRWRRRCGPCTGIGRSNAMLIHHDVTCDLFLFNGYVLDTGTELSGTWRFEADALLAKTPRAFSLAPQAAPKY